MIVVTGGEGFIGKNLVKELKRRGYLGVISLDTKNDDIGTIIDWFIKNINQIECIFHLGAITDTTLTDERIFVRYNEAPSMSIWLLCSEYNIPLIYASSAATYGDGSNGFDDEKDISNLIPLNLYGWSKHNFDLFAINEEKKPQYWYGLKFFNVYGFGEAHKGKMASVVYQKYCEIKNNENCVKLFKSHRSDFADGEQKRDFIYVDDVVDVCIWFYENKPISGIYNVGTGNARSFNELVNILLDNLKINKSIEYIDIPINIRDKYQYFTEAKIGKLRGAGYSKIFHTLEEGIKKYVFLLETNKNNSDENH